MVQIAAQLLAFTTTSLPTGWGFAQKGLNRLGGHHNEIIK